MWYFEIIKSSFIILILAVLAALALYVMVLLSMRFFNKYNTRNGIFIFLSIIGIPFIIVEFIIIFSLIKVKTSVVASAQEYAYTLASYVDGYKGYVSGAGQIISSTVDTKTKDVFNDADSLTKSGVSKIADKVHHHKMTNEIMDEYIDDFADTSIDKCSHLSEKAAITITQTSTSVITSSINKLPDNPIELLLEKYPILSNFLEDHNIQGKNAHDIMTSVFSEIKHFINLRILGCVKWPGCFLVAMCSLSILRGWRKKVKKEHKKIEESQTKQNINN